MWEAEVHKIILAGALAGVTFFEVVGSEGHTSRIEGSVPQRELKGDRLPAGPDCSPSGWQHDSTGCVRKQTPAAGHPPQIREVLVAIADRSLTAPTAFIDRCDCPH
jgi:hypothetical protein